MLPHALYFRGIEIAQFDRELSPPGTDVDGSRFRLHIADRADFDGRFSARTASRNGEDSFEAAARASFRRFHRRGARVIGRSP